MIGTCILLFSVTSLADMPADVHAQHATADVTDQNKKLMNQITELRAQVAKLQAAVQQTGPTKTASGSSRRKMSSGNAKAVAMMDDQGEMGSMAPGGNGGTAPDAGSATGMMDDQSEMGSMTPGGNGGTASSTGGATSGCCVGEMGAMTAGMARPDGGMGGMNGPSSTIPGQLGTSHLSHIGSTGFFLDHPEHITLTADQKMTLTRLKERTFLDRATKQRRIDQAEQELYTLTGAEPPDNDQIQAKITEIEKLRADQRIAFIHAVREAAQVLTDEQQKALLGQLPPANPCAPQATSPSMPSGTPNAGAGMKDM